MGGILVSMELINLLNRALARELQVSMQYMLQHTVWSGKRSHSKSEIEQSKPSKFVSSHSPVWFPGSSLKKIAITEMRHAERIAERISYLGGETKTELPPFKLGDSLRDILEIDKKQEETAIQLYTGIISKAKEENDETTAKMFKQILSDEEKHHKKFSILLDLI